ncbi:MAG: hypothetical protein V7724_04600 [Sediminicola sp.]
MTISISRFWGILVMVPLCFSSCNTPKYTYSYDAGKYLDFGEGKWLLNKTRSNSKIFDSELYDLSNEEFGKILGDSLIEISTLRRTRLIPTEIGFDLEQGQLLELREATGCNYLINVRGTIINEGVGSVTVPSDDLGYYGSNQSSVSIHIYHLDSGIELSSSSVHAKVVDQGEISKTNSIPRINTSSHTSMLTAAKKLIRKYGSYSKK